jgi:hypothetical protein
VEHKRISKTNCFYSSNQAVSEQHIFSLSKCLMNVRSTHGAQPSFAGVDVRGTSITVSFNSGMSIEIDATRMSSADETFKVAGQNVRVQKNPDGLRITVDGVSINLPGRLAA